jgi:hypothetical protein
MPAASPLHRSARIAKQPTSTVHASKKGEMLIMRKLGALAAPESSVANDQCWGIQENPSPSKRRV